MVLLVIMLSGLSISMMLGRSLCFSLRHLVSAVSECSTVTSWSHLLRTNRAVRCRLSFNHSMSERVYCCICNI